MTTPTLWAATGGLLMLTCLLESESLYGPVVRHEALLCSSIENVEETKPPYYSGIVSLQNARSAYGLGRI